MILLTQQTAISRSNKIRTLSRVYTTPKYTPKVKTEILLHKKNVAYSKSDFTKSKEIDNTTDIAFDMQQALPTPRLHTGKLFF
jgi:hypothetical protein